MKRQKNQVGGRKEAAPLARVGREFQGSDQARVYVPRDAEYAYYNELLQGYFENLSRWQDIFKEFEEDISRHPENEHYASNFLVIQTPDGRAIRPDPLEPYEYKQNPDLVIRGFGTRSNDPNSGDYGENYLGGGMTFYPGRAGKHLLVDADDRPVDYVDITVYSLIPRGEASFKRKLSIRADTTDYHPGRGRSVYGKCRYVAYEFQENTMHIVRGKGGSEPMSDAYACHLLNTIDALIAGSTSPTQQPERRARQKPRIPKALPPARRRTPRG